MHLTPYHLACPSGREDGLWLLYGTKTGALALLPGEVLAQLQAGDPPPAYQAQLAALDLLVADPEAERRVVRDYLNEVDRLTSKLTVSVILGMECNFRCRYCYEGSLKGAKAMSDATADRLVAFVEERYRPGLEKLHLDFYGGEPLLYVPRIKYLASRLKPWVESRGGVFEFHLVTNGSLLTPEVVAELKPLGLIYAKVTIDGLAENHNLCRPYKNGKASFDRVVANLLAVCQTLAISLAGNYTEENYRQFPALLDYLQGKGLRPADLTLVNFNMVMKVNDAFSLPDYQGGCASTNEPWLAEAALYIRGEVLARGFPVDKLMPTPCAMELNDPFTVHYNGDLYKCAPFIGKERFRIGDIWQGMGDYRASHHLGHWLRQEKCEKCIYLPLCFGGCRYSEFQRSGEVSQVDCMYEYYERTLPELLRQDLRYRYPQA